MTRFNAMPTPKVHKAHLGGRNTHNRVITHTHQRKNFSLRAIIDEIMLNSSRYKAFRAAYAHNHKVSEEEIDRNCDTLIMRNHIDTLARAAEAGRLELAARLEQR